MGCMGDTSWGWIILVFAVAMRTTIHGMLTSYGEFLATFSNVFQEPNMAFFGIIGSTAYGIISIGTPIALALTRWIGARRTVFIGVFLLSLGVALSGVVDQPLELFFTYGLLGGCGALLTNNPPFFLLSQYFHRDHKYYILTSSLPMVSFCLGSLIFNPIIQAMITSIGWKCTFAVYATLIFIVGCTAAATFRENEDQDENDKTTLIKDEPDSMKPSKCLFVLSASVYVITMFTRSMALFTPVFIMVKHLETLGVAKMTAAATVTIYSSADLCGRLFTSFLGDRLFKKRVMYLNIACCLLLGLENFAAGFATLYYQLVIFCVVAGFTAGAMTAVLFTSSSEVLDGWFTQELFAVSRVGSGLGIIVGIGMTGVIYDLSGSYHYVFHINLGVFAFAALCFGAVVLIRNCILRKQPNEDSEELPLTRPVQ